MIEIKTYNGDKATFYIQCKGLHSGRPLRDPIPNCFMVNTDVDNAFQIVYSLWVSKSFQHYIGGSVVPFIRIGDVKGIVCPAIKNYSNYEEKELGALELVDENIVNLQKKLKLIQELKVSLAMSINTKAKKKLKSFT